MYRLTTGLGIGPFAQFLCQAAVIGMGAMAVLQPLFIHARLHLGVHGIQVHVPACEQIFQAAAFHGGFRVQGKVHPLGFDVEVFF